MDRQQEQAFIEVYKAGLKAGVENRHKSLVLYLKALMKSPEGYSGRNVKEKREKAISAFAELERELLDSTMTDDQFFEKYILDLWFEETEPDPRSPLERVLAGEHPR